MQTYSFVEAKQNLAAVLDEANSKGEVRIHRRDGQAFILKPAPIIGSPLDIKGINVDISTAEVIDMIREGREGALLKRDARSLPCQKNQPSSHCYTQVSTG